MTDNSCFLLPSKWSQKDAYTPYLQLLSIILIVLPFPSRYALIIRHGQGPMYCPWVTEMSTIGLFPFMYDRARGGTRMLIQHTHVKDKRISTKCTGERNCMRKRPCLFNSLDMYVWVTFYQPATFMIYLNCPRIHYQIPNASINIGWSIMSARTGYGSDTLLFRRKRRNPAESRIRNRK